MTPPRDCFWEHQAVRGAYGYCEACGRVAFWRRCRLSHEERRLRGVARLRAPKRYRCEEGHEEVRLARARWPEAWTWKATEELRCEARERVA